MIRSIILALAAFASLRADVVSLYPLCTPETAVAVPEIVGVWSEHGSTFKVEEVAHNGYGVWVDDELVMTSCFARLGNELFANVSPTTRLFSAPLSMYLIGRVRIDRDLFYAAWLGAEGLEKAFLQPGGLKHERVSSGDQDLIVLTLSTPELQHLVVDALAGDDAFAKFIPFERAGPEVQAHQLNRTAWQMVGIPQSLEHMERALAQAERAVILVADNADYWNTLSIARLRVGRLNEALAALVRAESLRPEPHPEDLAARVLILHAMGLTAQILQPLERLRASLADHRFCLDRDTVELYLEAEKVTRKER